MGDRRTRFSIFYFVLAFLLLLGINYVLGQQDTARIPYSELKARIAAGQIEGVTVGEELLRASIADSLREPGSPGVLTAVRVPDDEELVPLLEASGVEYEGTTEGWFGQALGWLLPLGLLVLFWIWMLRRINPAQGVMTVGKNRARIVGEEGTGVTFADVAGADEAKEELVEVVEFLRTPEKFARLGAKIPKGVLLVGPPPAPARRCSRAPWPARPACRSSRSAARSSSRCSSASARRGCATCSSRPRRTRRASSSSTSWMRWARRAAWAGSWAATTSASRR